jgi:hypothetical protein
MLQTANPESARRLPSRRVPPVRFWQRLHTLDSGFAARVRRANNRGAQLAGQIYTRDRLGKPRMTADPLRPLRRGSLMTFSRGGIALHGKPAVSADASGRKPPGQIAVELCG